MAEFDAPYLLQFLILLLAALAAVTAAVRLGLGPIPGYLVAGMLVGPHGLALVGESRLVQVLAEFGVVFLLFAVGLELPLARLRSVGGRGLALGLLQIVLTTIALSALAALLGIPAKAALVLGMGLALSSTAVVVRILSEQRLLTSRMGRAAFAVLLLQDIAVAPMLIAVLALGGSGNFTLALAITTLKAAVFVAAALLLGPRLLEFAYRQAAVIGLDELFVALTLLVAVAFAWSAQLAGLSLAFGGLMAGMLLADTSFRHQVGADVRPFRGLLVGLFFLVVGMHTDPLRPAREWAVVLLLAGGLIAVKGALAAAVARALGQGWRLALRLGLLLAQGGEFAFVIWDAAARLGLLPQVLAERAGLAVVVSMMATPFLAALARRLAPRPEMPSLPRADLAADPDPELQGHVILAGADRVGLEIAAALQAAGIPYLGLDLDPERIARARLRGLRFYYGDVSRPEVLDNVHVDRARAFVLAFDDARRTRQVMALLRYLFPDLPVLVRAHDEREVERYLELGASQVVPEIVETGRHLLAALMRLLADVEAVRPPTAGGEAARATASEGRAKGP